MLRHQKPVVGVGVDRGQRALISRIHRRRLARATQHVVCEQCYIAGRFSAVASRISNLSGNVMIGHPFWGYANIAFDFLVMFVLPLAFAIRELILLRRDRQAERGGQPRR